MSEPFVSREELARRERLLQAEILAAADERSEKRVVAAVEAAVTNVLLHVGMAEKTTVAKIDGLRGTLRWQIIAALAGGQTLAAVAAAYMTGHGTAVEQTAAAILPFL